MQSDSQRSPRQESLSPSPSQHLASEPHSSERRTSQHRALLPMSIRSPTRIDFALPNTPSFSGRSESNVATSPLQGDDHGKPQPTGNTHENDTFDIDSGNLRAELVPQLKPTGINSAGERCANTIDLEGTQAKIASIVDTFATSSNDGADSVFGDAPSVDLLEVNHGAGDVIDDDPDLRLDEEDSRDDADSFKLEVDSMLSTIEETLRNRRGDIPPIGVRVPIEDLAEIDNPLEKDGRNTVIRGRYPSDHPFASAAQNLGFKLVSVKYSDRSVALSDGRAQLERMKLFFLDCNDVYRYLKGKNIKVPVIGGAPLNIFKLQEEVLLLGGLQNVVEKRAFRIVAQQLELPSTCTSAAYVLKGTYERFLYHYEQLLVFGRWPANANENVNMKNVVTETREKERRALRSSVIRLKRMRGVDEHASGGASPADDARTKRRRVRSINGLDAVPEGPAPAGVSPASARALKEFMASSSTDSVATWNFYCQLTGDEGGEFSLPRWALELPGDDAYEALCRAAVNVEKRGQGKRFECVPSRHPRTVDDVEPSRSRFVFDDFLRTGDLYIRTEGRSFE